MKKSRLVLKSVLASAVFVPGLLWVVGSGSVFASTSVIDEITIDVPSSCSLTNTIGSAHSATIETGVYQENIGETTFKVFCNDAEGFAVYAVGYTNNLVGNTFMKPAVSDISNAIVTGTATSGDTSNWAMKLTAVSGTYTPTLGAGFSNYHVIPDTYAKVASLDSNTDVTNGSSFKSTYAAYVSQSQLADSYTGKVKYTVVHPASTPPPVQSISELTYMQDLNLLSTDEKISVINSMTSNTVYYLTDVRDDRSYQIAKMKDGNIWMAENLDLGRTSLSKDLNSGNSNLPNTTTITASTFNGWKKTSTSYTFTTGQYVLSDGTDGTSGTPYGIFYDYYATTGGTVSGTSNEIEAEYDICPAGWRLPYDTTSGDYKYLYDAYDNSIELLRAPVANGGAAFPLSGICMGTPYAVGTSARYWTTSRTSLSNMSYFGLSETGASFGGMERDHGGSVRCIAIKPYHSFTISYGTGVSSVIIDGEVVADGEVITGEEGKIFEIGVITESRYAFNGWSASAGSLGEQNDQYTTYTIGQSDTTLSVSTTYVDTEMQNMSLSACTATPIKVYDNRDGHTYTVKQLSDGNCWMIENLDLGRTSLTTDLTSSNTNISTTVTATVFNNNIRTSGSMNYDNKGDTVAGVMFGTYYNYSVASLGSNLGQSNMDDATSDICPAGWRLPTGGNYGEVKYLVDGYDSTGLIRDSKEKGGAQFPINTHQNLSNFWTSVANYNSSRYTLRLSLNSYNEVDASGTGTAGRTEKHFVRCVIKRPTRSITVSYGTGVSSVSINGNSVANGSIITGEQGIKLSISAVMDTRYAIDTWSATSGTVDSPTLRETIYTIGTSDATLSLSASYVSTEMQNLNSSSCTSAPINVYDNRDQHVYVVKQLLDGKCWMMENLDLGRTELTTDLTSANTNLDNTVAAATFNSWKKTSGSRRYDAGEFISIDGTDKYNSMPRGTLYNYYAASAGTISGSSNSGNALYDICPAGWRLPTGGSSGEFEALYSYYNSPQSIMSRYTSGGAAFALAGRFYYSTSEGYGYYWSSVRYGDATMHILYLQSDRVSASSTEDRYTGCSIRCVLK